LKIVGRILSGNSPLDLIEEYTTYSGRMKALPDWINKGAVVGMQGGEKKVMDILAELERWSTPVGAFWNQDWCGNRIQYVGDDIQKRLWWNWEPDREVYPNWEQLVQNLRNKDIRMMIYINTFLADVTNKTSYTRNMFEEALTLGYFAKNADGTPLLIESGPGIEAGLIDLTNPGLFSWLKEIIKQNMIATGASGWMV
jgi:alpha-glucosidase (family GH31 glycosyl hydrolase)